MLKIAFFAALVALSTANLSYKDCGNGEIKSVEVTGCDGAVCTLHKGQEVSATIKFEANEDTKTGKIDLVAEYQGIKIPIPNFDTDACKRMNCPLKKGDTATLKYSLTVPAVTPNIEADVTAKIIGDGGKVLACGTFHGKVAD